MFALCPSWIISSFGVLMFVNENLFHAAANVQKRKRKLKVSRIFSSNVIERVTAVDPHDGSTRDGSAPKAEKQRNRRCEEWNQRDSPNCRSSGTHDSTRLSPVGEEFDREHREHLKANQRRVSERIDVELEQSDSNGAAAE
jgi:hypothetical protein